MGGRAFRPGHAQSLSMTVVLDAHGLTMLAKSRARLEELRRRGEWPAVIPAVVLTESLTGDHRHDYHENRVGGRATSNRSTSL